MAADSAGCETLTTVVTCSGDLSDPRFAQRFATVVRQLDGILGDRVKIRKLEPWNSVRVTLSIPREAALRLRRLADEGSHRLRALGILSVQVEGGRAVSLRLAGAPAQEVLLQAPDEAPFTPPNVVCPAAGAVPRGATPPRAPGAPFPFASMNQALHSSRAEPQPARTPPTPPPPPYPVALSSPLLVNLLQTDKPAPSAVKLAANRTVQPVNQNERTMPRTVPPAPHNFDFDSTNSKTLNLRSEPCNSTNSTNTKPLPTSGSPIRSQASTSSPTSALSTTSIRLNSLPNSTISNHQIGSSVAKPPPPPYTVAVAVNHRQWEPQSTFLDLVPTLTDLKAADLDELLERDLASPSELLDFAPKLLINPLTGELEPHSGGESDADVGDVFTGLPSPAPLSDEDTSSVSRLEAGGSDSETRSSTHSDGGRRKAKRGRESPKPARLGICAPSLEPEKIKLRLKLEKSEPVNAAYKVDVSFVQAPKRAVAGGVTGEELRVPPLHISLRGRHHFITNKKKKLEVGAKLKARKVDCAIGDEETGEKKPKKAKEVEAPDGEERSNSEPELSLGENNGERKRRLSQTEGVMVEEGVLGSTNVGTIMAKVRKEKGVVGKVKEGGGSFKKEGVRIKSVNSSLVGGSGGNKLSEKFTKQVALPTGEIDMEAKFKQRLMEGTTEKGIPRPPHRTEVVHTALVNADNVPMPIENTEKIISKVEPLPLTEKSPEPDKCNTPDRKQSDDKQASRSPNSGAQGEDSGIESMDALSEKSPNQASQSPHADITETTLNNKTKQVSDMLDIEAQLAKMEGLNGVEDLNENQHNAVQTKVGQCCELTSALQDTIKQQSSVNIALVNTKESSAPDANTVKTKEEPLPVRVKPPLYTYSNPDKGRDSASPPPLAYEENSNPCPPVKPAAPPPPALHKGQSLLEQLLIEIPPDTQAPSSPSPATRSVRTRALAKLGSPEGAKQRAPAKRKRHESDPAESEARKKPRKCSENAAELIKAYMGVDLKAGAKGKEKPPGAPQAQANKAAPEESSDSDEPLIEKVRKTASGAPVANNVGKGGKVKSGSAKNVAVSTRRSVRTTAVPAPNTRSKGDKIHSESEAIRRKTRSTDGENKRKKEVK